MACDKQIGMEKFESDMQFLDKCGASNSLKDIILELAQVQPEDSISFIVDYFNSLREKADCFQQAERHLKALANDRSNLCQKIQFSFECLTKNIREDPSMCVGKRSNCITGKLMSEFVNYFASKMLPQQVCDILMKKVQFRICEAVPIQIFRFTIFLLYYLRDVVELSQIIYNNNSLKNGSEVISATACHAITRQLKDALCKSKGLEGFLESLLMLSPDHLHLVVSKAQVKSESDCIMTCDDFTRNICAFLLEQMETFE